MPKSKSVTQKRRSQRLKQQSPLYKSGLSRTSRISRNTAQETKVNIQQDSLAGCTAIEPLNPNSVLNTPQEIDDAARLFAEFKQTFLPGDTGRIFIKDSKGNFKSHKIVNAELTMRIQNDNKGIIKSVTQVYNVTYIPQKGLANVSITNVKTMPLAGYLDYTTNYVISVKQKNLNKQQLLQRFDLFKTTIASVLSKANDIKAFQKLNPIINALETPLPSQNNETALMIFNFKVKNIEGVTFESDPGKRGGLITFLMQLAQNQSSHFNKPPVLNALSIFKKSNENFILNPVLNGNLANCTGIDIKNLNPDEIHNISLNCGLWVQISLPSVPHLVTAIIKEGSIFTFGGGYNNPAIAIPQIGFELGSMWVYSPDDLIFNEADVENEQVLMKWGFYNENVQNELLKLLNQLNRNYLNNRSSFLKIPGSDTKYYKIAGYYSSFSNRLLYVLGLNNCAVLGHCTVGGRSNVSCYFAKPWDNSTYGYNPEILLNLMNFPSIETAQKRGGRMRGKTRKYKKRKNTKKIKKNKRKKRTRKHN